MTSRLTPVFVLAAALAASAAIAQPAASAAAAPDAPASRLSPDIFYRLMLGDVAL